MKPQADWISALEAACRDRSQAAVARQLDVSAAAVNQVLKGTYGASTDRIEARVRGALMEETVGCPVLGDLPRDQCQREQSMGSRATSPLRLQLSRTCRTCPNAHKER